MKIKRFDSDSILIEFNKPIETIEEDKEFLKKLNKKKKCKKNNL